MSNRNPLRDLGLILLPLLLVGGGVVGFYWFTEYRAVLPVDYARSIRSGVSNPEKLAEEFKDENNDLVADVPQNPKDQIDPEVLTLGTLEADVEKARKEWKEFLAHLSKVTGKTVELRETPRGGHGIVEMMKKNDREGHDRPAKERLHIATLSTGTVPLGVNMAGFVPAFVMADKNDKWAYEMEILVPSNSDIKKPADLKGKTLTLTSMSSLSSYKAPVVVLWKEFGLLPDVDYKIQIASGQKASVVGVCKGEYQAVAVANDYLARVLDTEKLDKKDFRSIYKSPSYPPACFGYVHDLKPELAKKIREAFLTFDWKGTALEKAYQPANQVKFVEISYKDAFKPVRETDAALLELVGRGS